MGEIFYFDLALRRTVAVTQSVKRAPALLLALRRALAFARSF